MLSVDTRSTLLTVVRGDVMTRVEPDVIDIAFTLETKSVSNAVN